MHRIKVAKIENLLTLDNMDWLGLCKDSEKSRNENDFWKKYAKKVARLRIITQFRPKINEEVRLWMVAVSIREVTDSNEKVVVSDRRLEGLSKKVHFRVEFSRELLAKDHLFVAKGHLFAK